MPSFCAPTRLAHYESRFSSWYALHWPSGRGLLLTDLFLVQGILSNSWMQPAVCTLRCSPPGIPCEAKCCVQVFVSIVATLLVVNVPVCVGSLVVRSVTQCTVRETGSARHIWVQHHPGRPVGIRRRCVRHIVSDAGARERDRHFIRAVHCRRAHQDCLPPHWFWRAAEGAFRTVSSRSAPCLQGVVRFVCAYLSCQGSI